MTTTEEEFNQYYNPHIDRLVKQGYGFVVGGANGVDKMGQDYIATTYHGTYLHVYDKGDQNNVHHENVRHTNGFESYPKRDAAMTDVSICDVSYIHTDGAGSGTCANLLRREFGDETARRIIKVIRKHTMTLK